MNLTVTKPTTEVRLRQRDHGGGGGTFLSAPIQAGFLQQAQLPFRLLHKGQIGTQKLPRGILCGEIGGMLVGRDGRVTHIASSAGKRASVSRHLLTLPSERDKNLPQ